MRNSPDAHFLMLFMNKQHNKPTLADIERFCELVAKLCADGEILNDAREMAIEELFK